MTQEEAADLFGVTQPRISDLKNRKVEKFSLDFLVKMMDRAGFSSINLHFEEPSQSDELEPAGSEEGTADPETGISSGVLAEHSSVARKS